MTQAIQRAETGTIIERVIVVGDLAKIQPQERVQYYNAVCESCGLNPLTRPFEYIQLNGKLTLYARKDATDQLRALHDVSVKIVGKDLTEDLYVVTARATKPGGREDESIGAVPLGSLRGEARANALMKAETKAKRRVTLSICGLGFLDETEVASVPEARTVIVNPETGEVSEALPRISPHGDDEPGSIYQDPQELISRLEMIETLIQAGDAFRARAALGSKSNSAGSIIVDISREVNANRLSASYRKEIGKTWQRLNRQLEKLEKQRSAAGTDVIEAFQDTVENEELEQARA